MRESDTTKVTPNTTPGNGAGATQSQAGAASPPEVATATTATATTATATAPPAVGKAGASAPAPATATPKGPVIDPASVRLSQDYVAAMPAQKVVTAVPVRKPMDDEWVRTHPEWQLPVGILDVKTERETYLVDPTVCNLFPQKVRPAILRVAINRQGIVFVWPVRLSKGDKPNTWNDTAREASELATTSWIRLTANMDLGAYEAYTPVAHFDDPVWPNTSLIEILNLAFKDRYINSADHPVFRNLRGEA